MRKIVKILMVATVWSKQSILLVGDCITSNNKHFKEFFHDDQFDLLNLGVSGATAIKDKGDRKFHSDPYSQTE